MMDKPLREGRHSKPSKCESLDRSYANLMLVPDLSLFRALRSLRLDNNMIEEVPWRTLMSLSTLTQVDLSVNRISVLPDFLAEWTALSGLNLSRNLIKEIPLGLAEWKIDLLNLSYNAIDDVDFELRDLFVSLTGIYNRHRGKHDSGIGSWVSHYHLCYLEHIKLEGNPVLEARPKLRDEMRRYYVPYLEAKAKPEEEKKTEEEREELRKSDKEKRVSTRSDRRLQRDAQRDRRSARDETSRGCNP